MGSYNVYQYDRTTPQFTPDGRLLQVEYAQAASTQSKPLIGLVCKDAQGDSLCILATTSHSLQRRLLVLSNPSPGGNQQVVLGVSGVLSDSRALLRRALQELQPGQSMPPWRLAQAIAAACQTHAFGGGIRPYGSSVLVSGVGAQGLEIYQTDPSGGIREVGSQPQVWVHGGSDSAKAKLQRLLELELDNLRTTDVPNLLRRIANLLQDESQSQQNHGDGKTKGYLELVVISQRHGVYRWTEPQLRHLLEEKSMKP